MKYLIQFALFIAWLSPAFLGAQLSSSADTELHIQAGSFLIATGLDLNFESGSKTTNQGFIVTDQNLLAEGTLFTVVSGITPGTHFGRWAATVSLEVDGTLIAVRDLSYQPTERTTHKLLTSADVVGEFETTILPGENWTFEYNQLAGTLIFDAALPVDWLSFEARATGTDVTLNWRTAWEEGSDYFAIERLLARGEWEEIGQVRAAGTSTIEQAYQFIDLTPLTGQQLYYRLRQVDQNGTFDYSITRNVFISGQEVSLYPNPSHDWVQFHGPVAVDDPVEISNALGQLLFSTKLSQGPTAPRLVLPVDLPSGTYYIQLEDHPPLVLYFRR